MMENKYGLTFPQKNIWLVEEFFGKSPINTIVGIFKVNKEFDFDICEKAVNKMVEVNDALRLKLVREDEEVYQYVEKYNYFSVDYFNLENESEEKRKEIENNLTTKPFEVIDSPLYYFAIVKTSEDKGYIFVKLHHIVSDAWTFGNVATELAEYIDMFSTNEITQIEKPSYIDFIESEREYINSEKFNKDKMFWQEYLSGIEETVGLKENSNKTLIDAKRYTVRLDEKLNNSIKDYCKANRVSPYTVFMNALAIYLHRVTEKYDFVIGTPVLNRSNFKEKKMMGMFVSTMPVRFKIDEKETFLEMCKKSSSETMSLFRHQKYPYSLMLQDFREKNNVSTNLYEIMISYQNARAEYSDNEKYTTDWMFSTKVQDQFAIHIMDMDETGVLELHFDYLVDLFEDIEIEYIAKRLFTIIEDGIENNKTIETIEIMPEEEKNKILYEFNDTKVDYPKNKTVIDLFEEQVEKTPNNIALVFEGKEMTYKELNERANSLVWYLKQEKGIKNGDVIAIELNRSIEMFISIFAIIKLGATFMYIDSRLPKDRKEYMYKDSNTKLVINKSFFDNIEWKSSVNINNSNVDDVRYIIYTSGTTGNPKGVEILDENLYNLTLAIDDYKKLSMQKVALSITKPSFDMFIIESIVPLLLGCTMIVANEEQALNPIDIIKLIKDNKVNIMFITPSRLKQLISLLENRIDISSIKKLTIAGEEYDSEFYNILINKMKLDVDIYNGYGPTEATVCTSVKKIENSNDISIGKSINNINTFMVDSKRRLCPIFVMGEIIVSGKGISKGYLNNKELTDTKFINFNGNRTYTTGDFGYYNLDGNIIFKGRIDNQVKINGQRVELKEIEKNILSIENVTDVAVIVNSDNRLNCYIVSNKEITSNYIRSALKNKLPQYMIPSSIVFVDKIYIKDNGKRDDNKLLELKEEKRSNNNVNYSSDQQKIANVINRYMTVDNIDLNSNMFDFGLDSLAAISLALELSKSFNVRISANEIFENYTILLLEELINTKAKQNKPHKIILPNKRDVYPISDSQKGIFANFTLNKESTEYNIPFEIKFSKVDVKKLKNAIELLINSEDIFKSNIGIIDEQVVQIVNRDKHICVNLFEKLSLEQYIDIKETFIKPFDLFNDNLIRVNICCTESNTYLLIDVSHIIFDGESFGVFLDKLQKIYNSNEYSQEELEYGQFTLIDINRKTTEEYTKAREFYLNEYKEELTDNELILDKTRYNNSKIASKVTNNLDAKITKLIQEVSLKNHVTMNSIMFLSFLVTLSKYIYSNDVRVGLAFADRNMNEKQNILGMFVKTIPFRYVLNGKKSIVDTLKNLQNKNMEYLYNSLYSYDELVKELKPIRDKDRNPLFDVMFVYQNSGVPEINLNGSVGEISGLKQEKSKFDITFEVIPTKNKTVLNTEYNSCILSEDRIKDFMKHYINVLVYILNNTNNNIEDIEMISNSEMNIILNEYNIHVDNMPEINGTVIEKFENTVEKNKDNIAIICGEEKITYDMLNERANKLAHLLLENGVKKGQAVCIMMDKSIDMIIGIIAVMKCGGVYVPIEIDYPKERVQYMIKNTNSKIVLVDKHYIEFQKVQEINVNNISKLLKSKENTNITLNYKKEDNVYIMYTSGTTGNPKGVLIDNENILSLFENNNYIEFKKDDRIIQTGSSAFDATTFEYWGALLNGIPLYLLKKRELLDLKYLKEYIVNNKISVMFLTTQLFNQMIEYDENFLKTVRIVLTGGEAVSLKHINKAINNVNILYNVYGPTETTTFATFYNITKDIGTSIPIGKAITNRICYVVDKYGKLSPNMAKGELQIGGKAVSKGYINNTEMTNKVFSKDIFSGTGRKYQTGDLVYRDKQGNIEFLDRIDTQIKIRGFRIELEEISKRILEINGIKEAFLMAENIKNDKTLIAFYTTRDNIDTKHIISNLRKRLPSYMIPKIIIKLNSIPLNSNGKTDKVFLKSVLEEYISTNTLNEEIHYEGIYLELYNLYKEIIGKDEIYPSDSFFDIGGDSLLAVKLVTKAMAKDINITYQDVYKYSTIKELGDYLISGKVKESISSGIENYDYSKIEELLKINNEQEINNSKQINMGDVLLTGVTGFLGSHILSEIMENTQSNVYCLIRRRDGISPEERLRTKLKFFFKDKYNKFINKRIFVIEGDIVNENLTLIESDYNTIKNKIDVVINSAAHVKHYGNEELFNKINVNGVKNLIAFCTKNDKKLIHISTLSVSGNILEAGQLDQSHIKENTIFDETRFYIGQNLDNIYAYTKFEAEKEVYNAIIDEGLDAKVIRMGNLTGRMSDGKFQPNVEENAFANRLKTMISLKVLPQNLLDFYLEFTPIDYASKAIIKIAELNTNLNTFHLFNHEHANMRFVRDVLMKMNIELKNISKEDMTKLIDNYIKNASKSEVLNGIISDINKNKELEYKTNTIVKSDLTIEVLKKTEFKWPIIDKNYIQRYIGYLCDIGFLKKEE